MIVSILVVILVILCGVAAIGITYLVVNRKNFEDSWEESGPEASAAPESAKPAGRLITTMGGVRRTEVPGESASEQPMPVYSQGPTSLDDFYAQENNLWVCAYCHTINDPYAGSCCACGHDKKEK